MTDTMSFPQTIEEFMEQYKVVDTEQVYSNGVEFVPIFRVKQWFEHSEKHGRWKVLASGNDAICTNCEHYWIPNGDQYDYHYCPNCGARMDLDEVEE